jgi:hypothetical protein
MNRPEFFALLDSLTTSEIESRISSWDDEQLKLVEEYLQRVRQQNRARPDPHLEETPQAVPELAAKIATRANNLAMVALIIAIGAMLASIASGFVAFVALQH